MRASTRAAAEIVVRDFGPGVAPAERERIFERFHRGERERDGSVPGLGLGLHVARTLLRTLGGDVRCEGPDDGGAGAAFVIALPREQSESNAELRDAASSSTPRPSEEVIA